MDQRRSKNVGGSGDTSNMRSMTAPNSEQQYRPVPTTEDDAPFVCGNVEDSNLTPAEKVLLRFSLDNPAVDPRMFESLASELRALNQYPSLPTREQIAEVREQAAELIARWDYKTATGEEPDSDESMILPPHLEITDAVLALLNGAFDD